jgi:hypothetical protein
LSFVDIKLDIELLISQITMPGVDHLPDISKLKISELKEELDLYCIDTSGFSKKQDFTSALRVARETLPHPSPTYREPETPPPPSSSERGETKDRPKLSKSSGSSKRQSTPSSSNGDAATPRAQAPAVGHHTRKITLPIIPLTVPVMLPIPVM